MQLRGRAEIERGVGDAALQPRVRGRRRVPHDDVLGGLRRLGNGHADVDSLDDPVWGPSAPRGARITAAAHGARAQRRRVQQEAGCRLPSAGGFSFIGCRLQVRTKEAPAARPVTSNGRSDFGPRSATGTAEVSSASVSRRHAGISGFLANRDEMYLQSDEDGPQWERLLHAWRRKYGGDAVPVARVEEDIIGDEQLREALPDAFTRFIERVMGQFNAVTFRIREAGKFKIRLGKALKHRLGKALKHRLGRRFGLDKPPPHSRRRFPHHHHQGDHGTSGPDAPQDAG